MNKKSIHIQILALVTIAITCLLSCSKNTIMQGKADTEPLLFSPTAEWPTMETGKATGSGTKALVNSTTELQQYGISLLSVATQESNIYPVFNNSLLYYNNATAAWNYDITKYWIPGARYNFAAFAPYASETANPKNISNGNISVAGTQQAPVITISNYNTGKGITGSKTFDARNEDLLFATHTRDNTSGSDYSAVPLQFNHLLSCLTFYIRNATSNDIERVYDIKLSGLKFIGNINISLSDATVNATENVVSTSDTYFAGSKRPATGESTPFLPKGMSESDYKFLFDCNELTVLPQTVYGKNISIKFTIEYTSGSIVEYTGNLGNIDNIASWDKGKKYRYNITISSREILFQVVEVPWIEHEVEL